MFIDIRDFHKRRKNSWNENLLQQNEIGNESHSNETETSGTKLMKNRGISHLEFLRNSFSLFTLNN